MEARIAGICRGTGYIYTKLRIEADDWGSGPCFDVSNDVGEPLPYEWFYLTNRMSEGVCEVVVVMPLFLKGHQYITILIPDSSDETADACLPVSMERAKWESRLNRRIRKDFVDEVLYIEDRVYFERIHCRLWSVIEDLETGELVARIYAWAPFKDDADYSFEYFDSCGRQVNLETVILGEDIHPARFDASFIENDMCFSVRTPKNCEYFTISVRDKNNPEVFGFISFEPALYESARACGIEMGKMAAIDPEYHEWFLRHRASAGELEYQSQASCQFSTKISIVVPLFETPEFLFREMLLSVLAQSYPTWELVLVNASPENTELTEAVNTAAESDKRIKVVCLEGNLGISGNTKAGVDVCSGDYIAFLDHDDLLEPDTLYSYVREIEQNQNVNLLYCDEDKLMPDGTYGAVFFKSDFNIDLLRGHNYICHFMCVRSAALKSIEFPSSDYDGAQDHDIALKVSELDGEIIHVKKVLYHWRVIEGSTASADDAVNSPKQYANSAGYRAVSNHLKRQGIAAHVEQTKWMYSHHVVYEVQGAPLVSVIIPNKDNHEMLDACVQSILCKTTYQNFEIVIVENNSTEKETFDYYERLAEIDSRIRVVTWSGEFNFSKIINYGVSQSNGDYYLLLNNDTEVINGAWMEAMLGICQRDDVGIVGACLLYRDRTIQHAGVIIDDLKSVAHHTYIGLPDGHPGYFLQAVLTMDYSAVTAACMMSDKESFEAVGGFTEELSVAYNDVDYCLKVREQGKLVVYEPTAKLFHYESVSRGSDVISNEKAIRALKEKAIIYRKWAEVYIKGDPYFNPSLVTGFHKLRLKDDDD